MAAEGPATAVSAEGAALRDRVAAARDEGRTIPGRQVELGLDEAYAIQGARAAGRELKGYKLGLVSPAKQAQMGLDEPFHGGVFADMVHSGTVDLAAFIQPKVEPEVALVLGADVPAGADAATAQAAVRHAVLALDVLDSVWDGYRFSAAEVLADGLSAGGEVLGAEPLPWPVEGELELVLDGEVVSSGPVADLGDLPARVAWLAGAVGGLRAGQFVLMGSPGAAFTARPGALEVRGPAGRTLAVTLR
jgi:2-keto-4-pentenoate hydratase